jgi:GNAT superfamily N-acetyltransferase
MHAVHVAAPDEADAVAALVNAAFLVESFFKRGNRTTPEEIRRMMHSGEFLVMGDRPGAPDACVYARIDGSRGFFGMLSVGPGQQGRGLGRALIAAVEARAAAAGCDTMEIHVVNLREELPALYRRLGYTETGTLPFPDEEEITRPCHFIVMTKELAGVRPPA